MENTVKLLDALRGRTTSDRRRDEAAVEQYEQLLRTAPPEDLRRIHEEAFARLTPEQRDVIFNAVVERASTPVARPANSSPDSLAKTAGRIEVKEPGSLSRIFGDREPGFWVASALLATYVGYAVGCELSVAYLSASSLAGHDSADGAVDAFTTDYFGADGFL
jgi:hypothetical protein